MPKKAEGLTAAMVKTAKPGRYADGLGLYLYVKNERAKFWTFRYQRDGKSHELGLGVAGGKHPITLAQARTAAYGLVDQLRAGLDPARQRADAKAARRAEADAAAKAEAPTTFEKVAALYIGAHEASWRNAIHRQQWGNTLRDYAYPFIGKMAVDKIETGDITQILTPIWLTKPETASRVRGRIERVLDYAKTQGWRSGENPARWTGHLSFILAKPDKVKKVQHHPALPYAKLPAAMAKLAQTDTGSASRCLRFIVLTAARNSEARKATWSEIDLKAKTWTVPADRMKGGIEHRVPLSDAAIEILEMVKPAKIIPGDLIFPGGKAGRPLSDVGINKALAAVAEGVTVHGMRSTFRDWAAEMTNFPREICEQCLAHATGNAVELAYLRSDHLAKRAKLMAAWGAYATGPVPSEGGNVVPMHGTAVA